MQGKRLIIFGKHSDSIRSECRIIDQYSSQRQLGPGIDRCADSASTVHAFTFWPSIRSRTCMLRISVSYGYQSWYKAINNSLRKKFALVFRICYKENLYCIVITRTKTIVVDIHEVFNIFDRMHAGRTSGM